MKLKIKYSDILPILTFCWGLTATMPALQIAGLAVSNYIMLGIIILSLKKLGMLKKNVLIYILWLFFLIATSVVNIGVIPEKYLSNSTSMIFKFALMFLCIYCASRQRVNLTDTFLKGIYYSAIIQAVWMLFELFFWYVAGISLNEIVFGQILGLTIDGENWLSIKDGLFRPSGIGWDSAALGLLFLIAFILSDSTKAKICFAVLLVLSTSRHSMFGLFIILAIQLLQKMMNQRETVKKKNLNAIIIGCFLGLPVLIILIRNNGDVLLGIFNRIKSTLGLITGEADSSSIRHLRYYVEILDIAKYSPPLQILFGWGTFSAGYPYSTICGVYRYLSFVWTPESDLATFLVGSGIAGTAMYYYVVIDDLRLYKKNKKKFYLIFTILICGFMYFFARSVWTIEILLLLRTTNRKETLLNVKS